MDKKTLKENPFKNYLASGNRHFFWTKAAAKTTPSIHGISLLWHSF